MASYANSQRTKLRLAQLYAPAGLLLLTVILCFGAFWAWRRESGPSEPQRDVIDVRREETREREPAGV